jgi:hypothetical protein
MLKGLPANSNMWGVNNYCSTGPCYATANCNNSSAACFYAHGTLSTALKNIRAATLNKGQIPKYVANSLQNIITLKGGGLTPKQMQTSYWAASAWTN